MYNASSGSVFLYEHKEGLVTAKTLVGTSWLLLKVNMDAAQDKWTAKCFWSI